MIIKKAKKLNFLGEDFKKKEATIYELPQAKSTPFSK